MGFPEQEIVVTSTVTEADDGRIVTETEAAQGDNQIIRNASADARALTARSSSAEPGERPRVRVAVRWEHGVEDVFDAPCRRVMGAGA